jgi:hypothetical protein
MRTKSDRLKLIMNIPSLRKVNATLHTIDSVITLDERVEAMRKVAPAPLSSAPV